MRLETCIDHERACAAPVLSLRERPDAIDVCLRISPRKGDPQEVCERPRGEVGIINNDEQREGIERMVRGKLLTKSHNLDRFVF